MTDLSVAAVLTVHNRVAMTVACLSSLRAQAAHVDVDLTPFVLDDGSTDGTADAIAASFPEARVLPGDGTFYWNGGMRVAMAAARRADPDLYLWVNDDTTLVPEALKVLLDALEAVGGSPDTPTAVCGAVADPETGRIAYSGVLQDQTRPMRFDQVQPGEAPVRVDTMNGNCVLLTRAAVAMVGNLDGTYTHGMGDYDYGFRLTEAGGEVWLAPGVLGSCRANPGFVPVGDSVRADLARLRGVKYLPPAEWAHFVRAWGGRAWPLFWASPYLRTAVRLWLRTRRTGSA